MIGRVPLAALAAAALLAGCGGGDADGDADSRAGRADTAALAATTTADTAPAPADSSPRANVLDETRGSVREHPQGGFSIYWPDGCGRVLERTSRGETPLAAREAVFTCRQPEREFSVHYYAMAHDVEGNAAHPRFVVALVEERLAEFNLRTVRQRPLEAGTVQGVDVHAEGRDSPLQAWIRGLLVGTDVYVLMAKVEVGDAFADAEVQDFIYSFSLDS